jgi:hypothetical protein
MENEISGNYQVNNKQKSPHMKNPLKDSRYSVRIEFTGAFTPAPKGLKTGQRYVSRFCGEYIGFSETENDAWLKCIFHDDERTFQML